MAPRDGDVETTVPPTAENQCNFSSVFWNRLNALPMVQSTISTGIGIYTTSKGKPILGKGLGVLEYGVNWASTPVKNVACTIAQRVPVASTTAHKLDNLAVSCLDTLEHSVSAIRTSPSKIVANVKQGATSAINSGVSRVKKGASNTLQSGVRRVMKSYPGQKVVNGLDSMIEWSELTIEGVAPKGDKQSCDKSVPEEEKEVPKGIITIKLRNGMVIPLKLYLQVLRMVKHMLANMAGVSTRRTSPIKSPRKPMAERTRKLTPKKRLPKSSLVSNLTRTALGMLGLNKTEQPTWEIDTKGSPDLDDPIGTSIKRKHIDVSSSDGESDTESLNLASALDNYDSDIDSDYCPADVTNEDSLEYNSGDTESDLEAEDAGLNRKGEPLKQLKSSPNLENDSDF